MAQPEFSLSSDTYSNELEITSISGTESISNFFELKIDFKVAIATADTLNHESLTQDDITVEIKEIAGRDDYRIKGVFSQIEEFFEKSNPTNLAQMIERMLEAERKEYWETDEQTLKQLVKTYLEIKRDHGVFTENEKFLVNIADQAKGFGLAALLESANQVLVQELTEQAAASQQNEVVEGQKLEEVEQTVNDATFDWQTLLFSLLILLTFIVGGVIQQYSLSLSKYLAPLLKKSDQNYM